MNRASLFLLPGCLLACDPDGMGRPATDPTGTDQLGYPIVAIDPASPTSADALLALIQVPAESTRSGTISYENTWLLDGAEVAELAGEDVVPADWTAVGDEWTLQVVAVLDELQSEAASDAVTVGNSDPEVSVALEPSQPGTEDDIVATVEAEDADGEDPDLSYAWYVDGLASSHAEAVLPAEATARDETWLLQVLASDAAGAMAEAWAEVEIANTAPSLAGAVIAPQPFSVSDTPVCTEAGFEDADGDEAANLYAWFIDGALVEGAEESALDTSLVQRGDLVSCQITASDGDAVGNTVSSAEVEVGNAPPSAPVVDIMPFKPVAGQGLVVVISEEGVDPDGDEVSYTTEWTVDGVYYGDTNAVQGEDVSAGQTWEVAVTPSDGEAEGEAGTASVTVSG